MTTKYCFNSCETSIFSPCKKRTKRVKRVTFNGLDPPKLIALLTMRPTLGHIYFGKSVGVAHAFRRFLRQL